MKDKFNDDSDALENLDEVKISYTDGIIKLFNSRRYLYPPQVLSAVDYLCEEWDYCLEWQD